MSGFQIKNGGFYRTRDGAKAEVLSYSLTRDCWLGFRPNGTPVAWFSDGKLFDRVTYDSDLSGDLIAPWTEPKKGTVWAALAYDRHGVLCKSLFADLCTARQWLETLQDSGHRRIACVSVNWTEGEGL